MIERALGRNANIEITPSRYKLGVSAKMYLRSHSAHTRIAMLPFDKQPPRHTKGEQVVLFGKQLPSKTKSLWRSRGQSFVDLHGEIFLEIPGLIVDKTIPRIRRSSVKSKSPVDAFSDKASNVARWLLSEPNASPYSIREIARVAQVSLGTASKIVTTLHQRELVDIKQHGRRIEVSVSSYSRLFVAWASEYTWERNVYLRARAPWVDPEEFIHTLPSRFARAPNHWALTQHAGASVVSPHAIWKQVHLYVQARVDDASLEEIAASLNWAPDPQGQIVIMKPFYKSLWNRVRTISGLHIVDDLQLALDLWNFPIRGSETAEKILRTRLPWIAPPLA